MTLTARGGGTGTNGQSLTSGVVVDLGRHMTRIVGRTGREVEVVFDPSQHQIVLLRNAPSDPTRMVLADQGFRRLAVDGSQEMWMRSLGTAPEVGESFGPPVAQPIAGAIAGHSSECSRPAAALAVGFEAHGIDLG